MSSDDYCSTPKHILIVPSQKLFRRQLNLLLRQYQQLLAMVFIVVPAISIILMKTPALINQVILSDSDIPSIERVMKI